MASFIEMLNDRWRGNKTALCIGLDPEWEKVRSITGFQEPGEGLFKFCRAIVKETHTLVCAYKPNLAFFACHGPAGIEALHRLTEFIHLEYTGIPVILDAKLGDIGNTSKCYAEMAFGYFKADAVTLSPYLGGDALQPFLDYQDKGCIILCRTSNPGVAETQSAIDFVDGCVPREYTPYYKYIAHLVANKWNKNGNCGVVVGATAPDELKEVRQIVREMPILIPGIGAQGGDLVKTVAAGRAETSDGMIINISRAVVFAKPVGDEKYYQAAERAAREYCQAINDCLTQS